MIVPTVGRVVWWNAKSDPRDYPRCALIAGVNEDETVNLASFNHTGHGPTSFVNVPVIDDPDSPPEGCDVYAYWMPYQKGQASKTEQLEKQIGMLPATTLENASGQPTWAELQKQK